MLKKDLANLPVSPLTCQLVYLFSQRVSVPNCFMQSASGLCGIDNVLLGHLHFNVN